MSELGQRRRSQHVRNESAYPPIAAGEQTSRLVGSVPERDIPMSKHIWKVESERAAATSVAQEPYGRAAGMSRGNRANVQWEPGRQRACVAQPAAASGIRSRR